ncbi:endolytic transglycosylase MltG [Labrys okinawensis]|uniref:Endolytic murein transglycosylase n=1 Tax=Labrys okinawensis TaxID=346911 RepID=A0A2S9QG53_9HYPH|nr:endolytic transglycosylase MltG [Labrys okinawensis]PRH88337.1 endolytic transglycosylase MltG [Labrys okinawensis]
MIQPDAVAKPPTRSSAVRNPFVVAGNAVFVLLMLIAIGGYFGLRQFTSPGPLTEAKTVYVPKGSGRDEIADSLERQGVIDSATIFTTGALMLGHSNLKAGEYAFKPGASMYDVMNILVDGKVIQHSITIPEGLTSQMIIDRLNQDDLLTGDAPPVPPEGALLPDTYKYERGTTRSAMVRKMQEEQKALVDQIWKQRAPNLPLKSPAEMVTLASIVEKETGQADERPHVASVFINRLQKNMRLQSDPTVIYGMVGGKGKLDRALTSADLSQPTRFNTYTITGLPPSPIANPGKAAMQAVATPLATKDLYFVADGTGGHAFASTLDEHNKNVAKWRQFQQQGGNAAAAPSQPAPAPVPDDAAPAPAPAPAEAPAAKPPAKPCKKGSKACKQQTEAEAPPPAAAPSAPPAADIPLPAPPAASATPNPSAPPPAETLAAPNDPAQAAKPKKGGFDDPVANTDHDPLLDKTFDLNSPQSVQ